MVRSPVSWFDLCALPCFLRSFPVSFRAGVPGWLVPVGSDCASRRGVVSRGSAYSRSEKRVGIGSGVLARPFGRRGRPEVGRCWKRALFLLCEAFWSERRAGVGSGRRSSSARPSCRRLDCPSGLSFRCFGPTQELHVGSQRCLLGRAFVGKSIHEGPWVYEPDTTGG